MVFPFLRFFKKESARTCAANSLANEVSRAFVPPCIRTGFLPAQWLLSDQSCSKHRNPSGQLRDIKAMFVPSACALDFEQMLQRLMDSRAGFLG
ncbi:hypothetical protein ASF29_01580 [Rhizobium sp. Leaf262]|nr:hypothetical protein ASF29_01580 [Rhizobium sp. Leaf262]